MRKLIRTGAIASLAAAPLIGFAAPAFAENTVVVWNSTSIGPEITTTLSQKCPSTNPYPVTVRTSSGTEDSYDSQYLNYTNMTIDGRTVKMTFTNSQSKLDQHPTTLSVKLEILCSNVPQPPPSGVELRQSATIGPGGEALVIVSCPSTHSHVTDHQERHPAGVSIVDSGQEGSSYWVQYQNDDFLHPGSVDLYLTCSA
ncbi:hypothetical protein ABZ860_40195 [Microbispora sp. NPDC046973]|uniref:hypothetical protein n=1 Tax=Microbispora sp. NPDC046973 TaxID=3155022 RepID=UPI0033F5A171